MANNVLLLNFVIAILSSTFAIYEKKQLGLYYEVIIGSFPMLEFDEHFGSIVCASPPLNVIIVPFQWISFFLKDEKLKKFNTALCHVIYFPFSIVFCLIFFVSSAMVSSFTYLNHIYVLTLTILDSDETMDELSEKL